MNANITSYMTSLHLMTPEKLPVCLVLNVKHTNFYWFSFYLHVKMAMGSGGLMDKVSASQSQDHGFDPHMGHDHNSSYDTSSGWFQEAD